MNKNIALRARKKCDIMKIQIEKEGVIMANELMVLSTVKSVCDTTGSIIDLYRLSRMERKAQIREKMDLLDRQLAVAQSQAEADSQQKVFSAVLRAMAQSKKEITALGLENDDIAAEMLRIHQIKLKKIMEDF